MIYDAIPNQFGSAGALAQVRLDEYREGYATLEAIREFAASIRTAGNIDLATEIERRLPA